MSTSHEVYRGKRFSVRCEEVEHNGKPRTIEIVEHPGAVVILPLLEQGRIVLVRQHRFPARQSLWEVPAGVLDPEEAPAAAAARELREETGYTAGSMRYLWAGYSTPGICSELYHFFVATELTAGQAAPDEHEELEVRTFTLDETLELLRRDELRDAKTQVALLALRAGLV